MLTFKDTNLARLLLPGESSTGTPAKQEEQHLTRDVPVEMHFLTCWEGWRRRQGVTSAVRAEVFNKSSDDFLEDEPVKEEKQMKELVSKCRWLGKAI